MSYWDTLAHVLLQQQPAPGQSSAQYDFVIQLHLTKRCLMLPQHLGDEPQRAAEGHCSIDAGAAAALQPGPPEVPARQIRHPSPRRRRAGLPDLFAHGIPGAIAGVLQESCSYHVTLPHGGCRCCMLS